MNNNHLSSVTLTIKKIKYSFYNVVALSVNDQCLGSIGILTNHVPMLWKLTDATLAIKTLVATHNFRVRTGFIDVYYKRIHIIAAHIT